MPKNSLSARAVKKPKKEKIIVKACRKYHGTQIDKKKVLQSSTTPLLSIDWLQFWGKIRFVNLVHEKLGSKIGNFLQENNQYQKLRFVKREFNGDPIFHSHVDIFHDDENTLRPFCHISYQPKLKLPIEYCIIKFDNEFLYTNQNILHAKINQYLALLDITFHKWLRLDLAADFTHFLNNLHPQNFIKNFLHEKYIKRYSTSYSVTGTAQKKLKNHYIRFGSKSQPIQWYLYNKSKEMREKTDKPWIRNFWQNLDKKQDVWRLEFSIKPSQLSAEINDDNSTTSTKEFSFDVIQSQNYKTFFWDLFDTNVDFRHNDGQKRKDRMHPVKLFTYQTSHFEIKKLRNKTSSNRMDKIFLGLLEKLNQSWRENNPLQPNITVQEFITNYIVDRDLIEWFEHKFQRTELQQIQQLQNNIFN